MKRTLTQSTALLLVCFLFTTSSVAGYCIRTYSKKCIQPGVCVESCSTKQCYWGGLPITLYLGIYTTAAGYVPSANGGWMTGMTSSTNKSYLVTVSAELREEQNCTLLITPGTWTQICSGSEAAGDPCGMANLNTTVLEGRVKIRL